ncbi:MAG TPA: primosomal protein N', partial [Pseudomonadales bacterium]|nr:primosomal protein N' [Pseudomonadales bacterium]
MSPTGPEPITLLKVALLSPLRRTFDYLPPVNENVSACQPGQRIQIPFGSRQLIGIIVSVLHNSSFPTHKLRHALRILDDKIPLPPRLFALCQWTADYYHHPIGDVLSNALPSKLREAIEGKDPVHYEWRCTELGCTEEKLASMRAPKQKQALELLRQHPSGLSEVLLKQMGFSSSVLLGLEKKQLVLKQTRIIAPADNTNLLKQAELILTNEQAQCLRYIVASPPNSVFLLHGITGSGKTEVYLQAIHPVLKQGKQALVLVPEIGLTPQTVARFEQRFRVHIALMHSGLNDSERLTSWTAARQGEASIIIGTRSAIFAPLLNPGIIIVDEEHDLSYKQQEGLRYSARDLAVLRGKLEHIPVILGSATPSLESLHNAQLGRYHTLQLKQRSNNSPLPSIQLLDIRRQTLQFGLAPQLIEQIKNHLELKNQVLVFINRRGFAPVLLCQQCGWTADCPRCNARYILHKAPAHLHCHHCNDTTHIPERCKACHSTTLTPLGTGTERIEEGLTLLFPDTPLLRIDRDSTQRKHSFKEKLAAVHHGSPLLLLGTQMLAKGHHFPHVTLVAIVNADSGFLSADFRGPERMAQLITQVAGRAGRAEKPGHVVLQSHQPHHPALQKLLQQGYAALCDDLLKERQEAQLPPYTFAALFRAEANQRELCYTFLEEVGSLFDRDTLSKQHVELLGPIPAPMEKRAGRYRAQLLLQSAQRKALHQALKDKLPLIEEIKI